MLISKSSLLMIRAAHCIKRHGMLRLESGLSIRISVNAALPVTVAQLLPEADIWLSWTTMIGYFLARSILSGSLQTDIQMLHGYTAGYKSWMNNTSYWQKSIPSFQVTA